MKARSQFACRLVTRAFADSVRTASILAATALVAGLGLVTTSHAEVTYVAATLSNTDNAAGGADSTWADGDDGTTGGTVANGGTDADQKWRYRSGFGVGGIWEASSTAANVEDAVQIVTSVSVANGTYKVYVFFIPVEVGAEDPVSPDGVDNDFPIRAGNTPATLEVFDQLGSASGSTYAGYEVGTAGKNALDGPDALTFTATPTTAVGRPLLYGMLSTTQVVTDGTLRVYIDDFPATFANHSDARTWYDGIGYELIPESSEFQLTITPATAPATGFGLAWDSQAGKLYNLRTSTDLTAAISTWTLVEGDIEATPPTNTYPVDPAEPRRFYAVEEMVEPQ